MNTDSNMTNSLPALNSTTEVSQVTSLTSSKSNTPSPSIRGQRPKRSSSLNVNYDLKKRKIIQSYDNKGKRTNLKMKNNNEGKKSGESDPNSSSEPLYIFDDKGNIIGMNDISNNKKKILNNSMNENLINNENDINNNNKVSHDLINKATGLPLNIGPTERIKKESLWNYKKTNNSHNQLVGFNKQNNNTVSELLISDYNNNLKTHDSDDITQPSTLRDSISKKNLTTLEDTTVADELLISTTVTNPHVKIKNSELKSSKLFNQNILDKKTIRSNESSQEPLNLRKQKKVDYQESENDEGSENENGIENDDFCSSCLQTGSFLCCDTCPRSFHFLCLDPPVDPDNLPEGNWSCQNCTFKHEFQTNTQILKGEKEFLRLSSVTKGSKLFGKLLFQGKSYNPRQFSLPHSIKTAFNNVKTGDRGQYSDSTEKPELSYKLLFNAPYGQSVSKLDTYSPDNHYLDENNDPNNSDNSDKFLLCYKCGMTKFGSWEHPEDSRLLIKCDYCDTPWHLDCVPDVPRATLKNLGLKWKCPLHANTQTERRLNKKHQKIHKPLQACKFRNNGDIEIELEELTSEGSKAMIDDFKKYAKGDEISSIATLGESAVKLDFFSKIYTYKQNQKIQDYRLQENLIEKLTGSTNNAKIKDILPLIYFSISNEKRNRNLKKTWDFKELCKVAEEKLYDNVLESKEDLTISTSETSSSSDEMKQLHILKKLIESKPKKEIIKFFGLEK